MDITTFIARMIKENADRSLEKGQNKYRAYFVRTNIYKKWKKDVETILEADGYGDCIVTE